MPLGQRPEGSQGVPSVLLLYKQYVEPKLTRQRRQWVQSPWGISIKFWNSPCHLWEEWTFLSPYIHQIIFLKCGFIRVPCINSHLNVTFTGIISWWAVSTATWLYLRAVTGFPLAVLLHKRGTRNVVASTILEFLSPAQHNSWASLAAPWCQKSRVALFCVSRVCRIFWRCPTYFTTTFTFQADKRARWPGAGEQPCLLPIKSWLRRRSHSMRQPNLMAALGEKGGSPGVYLDANCFHGRREV